MAKDGSHSPYAGSLLVCVDRRLDGSWGGDGIQFGKHSSSLVHTFEVISSQQGGGFEVFCWTCRERGETECEEICSEQFKIWKHVAGIARGISMALTGGVQGSNRVQNVSVRGESGC